MCCARSTRDHAATPSARVVRAAQESAPNFRHAAVHPQTMHPDKNAAVTCGVRAAHMHAPNVFLHGLTRGYGSHACIHAARLRALRHATDWLLFGMQRASFVSLRNLAARNRILLYKDAA